MKDTLNYVDASMGYYQHIHQHFLHLPQTADIGVGISGQEGMQAVMASDFAISRYEPILCQVQTYIMPGTLYHARYTLSHFCSINATSVTLKSF